MATNQNSMVVMCLNRGKPKQTIKRVFGKKTKRLLTRKNMTILVGMHRAMGILFFLVLFGLQAAAVSELRIAGIEPRNPPGEFRSSLSAKDLNSISVLVQNLSSTENCDLAVVVMDINEAETGESLIAEQATSSGQTIGSGSVGEFVFTKNEDPGTGFFKLISTAEGAYRINARAKCNNEVQHSRSFIFSLTADQKLDIPETPLWLGALIGIAVSLFLWPEKNEQKVKNKESA